MAEVKNAFIKSKMNKDLDARLIPQGEYRDAVNVQVSKSEGDDVGALENVLGNISIANFENNSGVPNLTCIGYFVNDFESAVYLFFTDYTDPYNTPIPTYNPSANNFIYRCDLTDPVNSTKTILVQGAFLNFSTNRPIIGVNVLEDFLFFTDNRNQPRKINISFALSSVSYYTNEDNISVAKYYPYKSIDVIKETSTPGEYETTMYDAFSQYIPLNNNASPNISNPYYESNFPGDPQYLEDKFVRFSYRFKFSDGEYSLIAPFTQICFIPKQDGYFLQGDEKQTFGSTIVKFMENKINKIDLQIPLPSAGDQLLNNFHISEIDIIYKESDGLALQVVETIPVDTSFEDSVGSNTVFEYSYLSQKPYKTLPSSEITRVYDKVPVRALGQEIISNRVVYSNFQDKHTPPNFIKYQVGANEKYNNSLLPFENARTPIEYPNHSLKQNRNYQVGFVLADRYGRQSTVILSNDQDPSSPGGFGADTVYLPYRSINDSIDFLGDSLKISVNEAIQSNKNDLNTPNQPGLYNGNSASTNYNPLGWETYKIVVKQLEQEYYNVYTNGAIKGDPFFTGTAPNQNTSFITLLNDNINKIPRDLSEVGPQDKTFRSSVRLFGRVENTDRAFSNIGNAQFIPQDDRVSFTTNAIEDLYDLFDVLQLEDNNGKVIPITDDNNPYYAFFRSESNPFVAEFITSQNTGDQFGLLNKPHTNTTNYVKYENLAILETAPTISRLELYYETSTSGDIDTLNQNAGSSSGGGVKGVNTAFQYTHFENYATGTDATNTFWFVNFSDAKINPAQAVLTSVTDNSGTGANRSGEWTLVSLPNSEYKLQTNDTFYYTASQVGNAGTQESYNFTFQVTTNQGISIVSNVSGLLQNSPPSITNSNATPIQALIGQNSILTGLAGFNGSADTAKNTDNLTFTISSSTGNGVYSVVNNNEVQNSNTSAGGTGSFTVQVTDNGNPNALTVTKTFDVIFDEPSSSTQQQYVAPNGNGIGDGSGVALFLTNSFSSYLTNNIPNNLGNTSTAYVRGLTAITSGTNPSTISVCTGNTLPTPGLFEPNFFNFKSDNALSAGAFYVYINPYNSQTNGGTIGNSITNVRFAISRYDTSQNAWVTAVDMNGVTATATATFLYSGSSNQGYKYNFSTYPSSSQGSITIQKDESNSTPRYGGLVYAFDIPGEYRIIHGNFQSNFGAFDTSITGCNNPNTSFNMESEVEYGDFYYAVDEAGGFNKTIGPPIGGSNTVYRYQISQGSCGGSFVGTNVYAREPLAKYVTQIYSNLAKTNLYTSVAGTDYRIKRMENLGSGSGSNSLSPEYTKDGSYSFQFQNTTGLVNPGTQSPCLY